MRPITALHRVRSESFVNVQWDSLYVRILHPKPKTEKEQLLREYVRQERGRRRIRPEDNPKKMPFTTAHLLARAARTGSHIGAFCKAIHDHKGEPGILGILGVFSLAKKFGIGVVRYRKPYQTRHTFASMMLMAGENPMWVAKQRGYTDCSLTAKRYARWIPSDMPDAGNKVIERWSQFDHNATASH